MNYEYILVIRGQILKVMHNLSGLKITFLAGTLGQGGAERQLFYIIKTLKENGSQITLFCLTQGEYWEGKIKELDIPVIWVGESAFRFVRLLKIIRELKKNPPCIFQSQHFYANLYVVIASKFFSIQDIGAIRSDVNYEIMMNGKFFGKANLHLPSQLVINSINGYNNALGKGVRKDKLHYLSNIVDTVLFKPYNNINEEIQIIAVGGLNVIKRFDRIIDIISIVKKTTNKKIKVNIFGEGKEKNKLSKMIKINKLTQTVFLPGKSENINKELTKSDIFIFTSDREGTPNVILEAMASGLPVISTNVGGIPNIIQNKVTGFLYRKDDLNGMATCLINLISDKERRSKIGSQARRYIEEEHSQNMFNVKLKDLYNKVLTK